MIQELAKSSVAGKKRSISLDGVHLWTMVAWMFVPAKRIRENLSDHP